MGIDEIKQNLIEKINASDDEETLASLLKLFAGPTRSTAVFVQNKMEQTEKDKAYRTIPKEELTIAKELVKFMTSVCDKTSSSTTLSKDDHITFSPDDPEIRKFLDRSTIVKEEGVNVWIDKINRYNNALPFVLKIFSSTDSIRWDEQTRNIFLYKDDSEL